MFCFLFCHWHLLTSHRYRSRAFGDGSSGAFGQIPRLHVYDIQNVHVRYYGMCTLFHKHNWCEPQSNKIRVEFYFLLLAVCLGLLKRGIPLFLMSFPICLVMSTGCPEVPKSCPRSSIRQWRSFSNPPATSVSSRRHPMDPWFLSGASHSPVTGTKQENWSWRAEVESRLGLPQAVPNSEQLVVSVVFTYTWAFEASMNDRWIQD